MFEELKQRPLLDWTIILQEHGSDEDGSFGLSYEAEYSVAASS